MRYMCMFFLALAVTLQAQAEEARPLDQAVLYKSPDCTCCEGHARYLRNNGIPVTIVETPDLSAFKKKHGVPPELEGCHTIVYKNHIIEGHVSVGAIRKLLRERSMVKGISLPGMPLGSPGMGGPKEQPFVIYEIGSAEKKVFLTE